MSRAHRALVGAFISVICPIAVFAQEGDVLRAELMQHFDMSINKVIALAEAMPADKFEWKPSADAMPVGHVYAHIAHYNYMYPATAMGVAAPAGMNLDTLETVRDKERIVALLKSSAEHVRRSVSAMSAAQLNESTRLYGRTIAKWAVMLQLVAHMNEHLGQSIAYARANEVVPPWSR